MTSEELRAILSLAVEQAGSQVKWAELHGVTQGFVSQVLRGESQPSQKILNALGLESVTSYRKVSP